MKDFYKDRRGFYFQHYWSTKHDNFLIPNGFIHYPTKEYDYFVTIINNLNNAKRCNIMDVCCGNGLLLKHLIEHCDHQIIPFGIDFISLSIEQAINVIHPDFRQNFFISNAIDFDFSKYTFDFILLDPYHFLDTDLKELLPRIIKQTNNSIIFYTYIDVLEQAKFDSIANFPVLKNMNTYDLEVFNYEKISIAILQC